MGPRSPPTHLPARNPRPPQVRKMAYMALAERVPLEALPTDDAVLLVRRGLGDRAALVRDTVAAKLVMTWLNDACEGEPLRLVHALDVQRHPGAQYG